MERIFAEVESATNDWAVVRIQRGTMCGDNCSNCGMCETKNSKIKAKNTAGAKKGDSVVLSLSTSKGLKAAMLAYGIPVLVLVFAMVMFLNAGFSEAKAVIFSFLIMAFWFLGVFVAEKKGLLVKHIIAEIIEIR